MPAMQKIFMLVLALIFIALLILPGCRQSNRPSLLIYSPHGMELLEAFQKKFEAAHPEVDVRYLDMGSQQIYDRVKLEQANPQADIWWGAAGTTFDKAANDGLLLPYRPSWADKVDNNARDSQDRWYATFQTPEVIVYNKAAIKSEDAPKDWDDLLAAKWQGKLIIRDPLFSDTMRTIFGAMILRQWGKENGPAGGYDWLRKLDANTKEYAVDGTVLIQKLARQEGLITIWDLPDVALPINRYNLPLAFRVPAGGAPTVIDGIAIIKGTRQPQLAREFYEFVTTEDSLLIAARDFYHPPARLDIDRSKLPSWLNAIDIKPMPLDQNIYRAQIQDWMLYWDSHIRNH